MKIDVQTYKTLDLKLGQKVSDYGVERIENDIVYTYNENDDYGLSLLDSKTGVSTPIVKPQYYKISSFNNGLAIVYKYNTNNKYNLINKVGKEILKDYRYIEYLSDGLYLVKDNLYGVVNEKDEVILKNKYDYIKYHKINNNRFFIVGDMVSNIRQFCRHHFIENEALKITLYGLMDINGKELIKEKYRKIIPLSDDKLLVKKTNGYWSIIDYQDNVIKKIDKKYTTIDLNNDVLITRRREYRGIMDLDGNELIEYQDLYSKESVPGLISLKNDIYSFYNKLSIYPSKKYDKITDLNVINKSIYCLTYQGSDYEEYVDLFYNGVELLEGYSDIYQEGDYIVVIKDDKIGLYDKNINLIFKPIYDDLIYDDLDIDKSGIAYYELDNQFGLIDINGKIIKSFEDDVEVLEFKVNGNLIFYRYRLNDNNEIIEYGIIDRQGKDILKPIRANKIQYINDELILVDNYLYRLDNLKYEYHLDFILDNEKINYTFDKEEKQKNILLELMNVINNEKIDDRKTKQLKKKV